MKNLKYKLLIAGLATVFTTNAQVLNWASLRKDQKHIININAAADYALTYGAGYGYQLKSKLPVVLSASYSFPSGGNISDDFKTKIGGQTRWLKTGDFYFSAKLQGIFRRFENSYARLLNFGSDMSATAGYYKHRWFVSGELGFDKAIVTHFKHFDSYKANFPGVKDGWYDPSTGGNLYYGLQTGYSFKKKDVYLKAGKLTEQDFRSSPMLPFYAELGINIKFR